MWWPCLLTDRDEISNLYRGPSIDTSYQVSIHLAKRFQRRRFKKIDQSETRIACGRHVFVNQHGRHRQSPQVILVSECLISKILLLCNRLVK
jgi:hypothetical protein